ncbi:MAG TPA: hypothetical protein VMF13_09540 [Luteitalea sp.]|nr:hypothetical protein [Luteitalea sp.]
MMHPLVEYFRCPEQVALTRTAGGLSPQSGYFRAGAAIGYGRAATAPAARCDAALPDLSPDVAGVDGETVLPFDLAEVVGNLRHERYPEAQRSIAGIASPSVTRALYYLARPLLPVPVRKHLQRWHWKGWQDIAFPRWPVDASVDQLMRTAVSALLGSGHVREFPFIWFWPDGAPACGMVTHDVEGPSGAAFCGSLMDLDERFAIPSSFQVVPEAPWSTRGDTRSLVEQLRGRGFEVNVHDLSHDGRLFRDRERFLRHATTINARGREFGSRGFRSGAMYRRQDWLGALDIAYDMSVPNVAHLEPQRGGCCTVMPYFNGHVLELPLTTAQDYTIFHVIGEYSTALWERQIAAILEENGLISVIAHPDYLLEARAQAVYEQLLDRLHALRATRGLWLAAPGEIDRWWRQRHEMTLVREGAGWRVKGPGSERARVAWARLDDSRVVYDIGPSRHAA